MPTQSTYYLDAPKLKDATVIYTDAVMVTKAGDGWYSDGDYVRQISSGVLLAPSPCEPCTPPTNSLSWDIDNDLGAYSSNIVSLTAEVDVDGVNYLNEASAGTGTVNVPAGNALMNFEIEWAEPAGSMNNLRLIIQSPSGTTIQSFSVANPVIGETYSVSATRYFAASTSVKFLIETY